MKKTSLFGALGGVAMMLGITTASATIVIDPADCGMTLSCITGNETSQSEIETIIEGLYPGIVEAYKQDQGGGEFGPFADDYSTQFFNTPSDPADALITWNGPDKIDCPNCYALVKDGNQVPAWYFIDISGWDGMMNLDFQNFWPAQGAISNVGIWTQAAAVPVPAAVWLFGSGLIGLVGMARRRKS